MADVAPAWSPYRFGFNNPIRYTEPTGMYEDDHYINRDGSIRTVKTDDSFDRFYTQGLGNNYNLVAQLEKNEAGLVEFPESGLGFSRYGEIDAGGISTNPAETVGHGDHFVKPEVAAALFGVISELRAQGLSVSLGDMSSSNGSDPWQAGMKHHGGHGHLGSRSGLDVDFRYLNNSGSSFRSPTATSDKEFSRANNIAVYRAAERFGFTKNYQGTLGNINEVTKMSGHNDHGHLGLQHRNLNWQYIRSAPASQRSTFGR